MEPVYHLFRSLRETTEIEAERCASAAAGGGSAADAVGSQLQAVVRRATGNRLSFGLPMPPRLLRRLHDYATSTPGFLHDSTTPRGMRYIGSTSREYETF